MDFNIFLNEEENYKYYILKLLDLKRNSFFSQKQISELLGISRYKFEKFLREIELDGEAIQLPIRIQIENSGEIVSKGINNLTVKKIRLYYLEQSIQYQLLDIILSGRPPSAEFVADKLFISRAAVYKDIKKLNISLKKFGLKIKNFILVGEEIAIRSFWFSLLNEFYCGIGLPFDKRILQKINEFKILLFADENIYPTKVQEYRIDLFLGITFVRSSRNNFLNKEDVIVSNINYPAYIKLFPRLTEENQNNYKIEIQNILFFCYTEGFILKKKDVKLSKELEKRIELLNTLLTQKLKSSFSVCNDDLACIEIDMLRINRKWLYFHFIDTTFIYESQKSYFQEVYFECDSFIRNFFKEKNLEELFKYPEEKIKIYYDYLFLLTTKIPTYKLEEAIHICVDFSHGDLYNEFIKKSIESFKDLNVIFEHKATAKTQIYISDFVLSNTVCKQIIWKNPPTPSDWKYFGNMIVKLKGGEE